jgi:hypothetical protein
MRRQPSRCAQEGRSHAGQPAHYHIPLRAWTGVKNRSRSRSRRRRTAHAILRNRVGRAPSPSRCIAPATLTALPRPDRWGRMTMADDVRTDGRGEPFPPGSESQKQRQRKRGAPASEPPLPPSCALARFPARGGLISRAWARRPRQQDDDSMRARVREGEGGRDRNAGLTTVLFSSSQMSS